MKQSQELSNLKSSDEDYFDSIFGFDDHALENLSDDLIIIADSPAPRGLRRFHRAGTLRSHAFALYL